MTDFDRLRKVCREVNTVSATVLDEFLVYYAAARDKLDNEMDNRLKRYQHIVRQMPENWVRLIKSQYIAHRIFKKGGLIHKYLNHSAIKDLPDDELNLLKLYARYEWRFSFFVINNSPETDFYEVEDVFNGEDFLLFSPSLTLILKDEDVCLWFNLVAFNGACWQTFGPVSAFLSFQADDIFFFATELNPSIEDEDDLLADLENNPIPYMGLACGSKYPRSMYGNDEMLEILAEHELHKLDTQELRQDFKIEYTNDVYKISPLNWDEPPHLAAAYFNEAKGTVLLTALTDRGFDALVSLLNKHGFDFPEDPDIRVNTSMRVTINTLLKREVIINPYDNLFVPTPSPEKEHLMDSLNNFMQMALPYINAGEEPNVESLAKAAGVDPVTAKDLLSQSIARINHLKPGKKGKT